MIYVRITFEKTDSGSRSDDKTLDAFIRKARWFHPDPHGEPFGYAGFNDSDFGVLVAPCVQEVGKDEAIDFKRTVDYVGAKRRILATVIEKSATKTQKMQAIDEAKWPLGQPEQDDLQEWIDEHAGEWGIV